MAPESGRRGADRRALAAGLLIALSLLAFGLARSQRSQPDIVNTVVLGSATLPGGTAEITFELTRPEGSADVLVIPNEGVETVATVADGTQLMEGSQRFLWDLRDDRGSLVPPGSYAVRVLLGDQDRDIRPPGRIEVEEAGGGG